MADARAVVAAALETFNTGDVDAALEYMHPNIAWSHERLERVAEAIIYRGRGEVRRFWESYFDSFERFNLRVGETQHGDGWVACHTVIVALGRGSKVEVESPPVVYLYKVEDDLITRVTAFPDMDEALAAARL